MLLLHYYKLQNVGVGVSGGDRNVLSLLVSSSFIAVAALCCVSQLTRLRTD